MNCGVDDVCEVIADLSDFDDELERLRSVRLRSQTAMAAIWDNVHMIERLDDAGIGRFEIPVVLKALGNTIDVEVAAELLHIPGIPGDDPAVAHGQLRLGDSLSLLYIAGKHYGIEPDYQLALGQMPGDEITQLRLLMNSNLPPRRFAEILAVAETTKLAIRARKIGTLSVAAYSATAGMVSWSLGPISCDATDPWPVPASTLATRFGHGYWDQALGAVGLKLRRAADRFEDDDLLQALRVFTAECTSFNFPTSVEIYDRWVMAEAALGSDRPSALGLMARYRGWEAALERALNPHDDSSSITDSSSVIVDPRLFEWEDPALEAAWVRAGEYISELLASMPRNRCLHIQYGDPVDGSIRPYAQGTRGADGVWCEIVSDRFLPDQQWPIDTEYLEDEGWLAPDEEFPQWCKEKVELHEAGQQILHGLRYGRLCPDPWQLRWSTRQLITGPGPDHGVTMEDALAGEIQTLRNAG